MTARPITAGVALALALGGAAAAQEVTLRFASLTPEGGYIHEEHLRTFAERVEADSGGRIAVDLQPVGVFGPPPQLYELVESGVIDMAWTVPGYTSGRFPQSAVVELPFLFENAETGSTVYWTMYEEGHFDGDYGTVKPLALYTHRPYGIFTTERPVETLDDMAGLKVRTPSALVGQALEMAGAVPVGMPVTEMAEGLRLGAIDSSVFPFEAIDLFGLEDLLVNLTDAKFAAPRFIVLMNQARYDSLPNDLKAVIDRHSGLAMSQAIGAGLDAREAADKARYAGQDGYTVIDLSDEARSAMMAATEGVYGAWIEDVGTRGVDGQALLDRARALAE